MGLVDTGGNRVIRTGSARPVLVISGVGALAIVAALVTGAGSVTSTAIGFVPGVVVLAVASVAVYRVDGAADRPDETRRLLGWVLAGALTLGGVGLWHSLVVGVDAPDGSFAIGWFTALATGILFGSIVWTYDAAARSHRRAERAEIERRQETVDELNRLIRHHLLNGLNVVDGRASLLEDHVDDEGTADLRVVRSKSSELAETIQRLRRIATHLADGADLRPVELRPVLEEQIAAVRDAHEDIVVEADDVPRGHEVFADETLSVVLSNLLTNAVQHNDAETPRIEVAVEWQSDVTTITVADNGPGVPDDLAEALFDASVRGEQSGGEGLGLFLTKSLVEGYGGDVRLESGTDGATFTVVVPTA